MDRDLVREMLSEPSQARSFVLDHYTSVCTQKSAGAVLMVSAEDHQLGCPFASVGTQDQKGITLDEAGRVSKVAETIEPCVDRQCCVFRDLRDWFGFGAERLPDEDFVDFFTDVAHGGQGDYERLVVLGGEALEVAAETHIASKFNLKQPVGIPSDVTKAVPPAALRQIWTMKRVERVCSISALNTFGTAYLSTCQTLPTRNASVKFVKACIGYSLQVGRPLTDDSSEPYAMNIFQWMPNVIEHIYWIQKHRNASGDLDDVDADLLLDLQEYFGYPFNRIVPRVQEIVSLQHHPLGGAIVEGRGDVPTGKELVRFHATEYFKTLSMEADNTTTVPPERRAAWVADEVAHFTQSMVVRVFGCTWMNLAPFLTRYALLDNSIAAKGDVYEDVVYQIVAACYVLSTDDRARVWMAGFVHRLRQIQLSLHLQELEIRMNHLGKKTTVGPYDPLPLAVFQGLDIYRWSSLSRQLQQRRFLADWGEEGHQTEPFFRDFVKEDSNATKWQPTLDGKALCESVKTGLQTLMSKLPQLRRPKVPYEVMSASEPPQPELHGALRRRKNQRYPATATARATTEDDNDGGHLWRPPGALFMKPRKVNWPEGERQQYLYGRNAQNVPAKDDLRVKIRYDPNPPPPPQFTPKIDQPKTAEDDSSSEDTWRQPLQFDIHEEGKDTKTLTARIHPRAGGDVEAQLIRHRSDSSSSLPAGVHAFQFYREDDSPRVEYRGPGVVKGGRRVR